MFPALSLALNFLMPFLIFKAVCKSIKLTYNPTSPMLVRIVQFWLELLLNWMKKRGALQILTHGSLKPWLGKKSYRKFANALPSHLNI